MLRVFWQFFLLGCTSFGGPAAHLGYFRRRFVEQLRWLDDHSYARLIALCHFLPGPSSSQTGFAIGLQRAGVSGGLAAFAGFTLPSFVVMLLLATLSADLRNQPVVQGVIDGLKLLAVVVVADAVLGMARQFWLRRVGGLIGLVGAFGVLLLPGTAGQLAVLGGAALIGALLMPAAHDSSDSHDASTSGGPTWWALVLFLALFASLPALLRLHPLAQLFAATYQAGSLVFGGGHVVLPLLQATVEGVGPDRFLTGYAAAQAVPGPMFTITTFLGAEALPETPVLGGLAATLGVFLPGFLLVIGLRDGWARLSRRPRLAGAFAGINAAVVGILLAALYRPVAMSAIHDLIDVALVTAGFLTLRFRRLPIVVLVAAFAVLGAVARLFA